MIVRPKESWFRLLFVWHGSVLPTIRPVVALLGTAWVLLIHTDGVSDRMDVLNLPDAMDAGPQRLANAILTRWGRHTDDATIVVACPASSKT